MAKTSHLHIQPVSNGHQVQSVTHQLTLLQAGRQLAHKQRSGKVGWRWAGFSGKTLWDWLQLLAVLAVPLAVAFGTTYFSYQQSVLADIQHQREMDAANLQHVRDVEAASDQRQEAILKAYQDDIKELMLNRGLITSKPGDEVRVIVRTEVLSALRQLDSARNRVFLQFLQDARLIGADIMYSSIGLLKSLRSHNIVDFQQADLSGDALEGVNLTGADLRGADLTGAHLDHALLRSTELAGAYLDRALMKSAQLQYADLQYANLRQADLSGADLTHAVLEDAIVTTRQLAKTASLRDAIMPDGSKHP